MKECQKQVERAALPLTEIDNSTSLHMEQQPLYMNQSSVLKKSPISSLFSRQTTGAFPQNKQQYQPLASFSQLINNTVKQNAQGLLFPRKNLASHCVKDEEEIGKKSRIPASARVVSVSQSSIGLRNGQVNHQPQQFQQPLQQQQQQQQQQHRLDLSAVQSSWNQADGSPYEMFGAQQKEPSPEKKKEIPFRSPSLGFSYPKYAPNNQSLIPHHIPSEEKYLHGNSVASNQQRIPRLSVEIPRDIPLSTKSNSSSNIAFNQLTFTVNSPCYSTVRAVNTCLDTEDPTTVRKDLNTTSDQIRSSSKAKGSGVQSSVVAESPSSSFSKNSHQKSPYSEAMHGLSTLTSPQQKEKQQRSQLTTVTGPVNSVTMTTQKVQMTPRSISGVQEIGNLAQNGSRLKQNKVSASASSSHQSSIVRRMSDSLDLRSLEFRPRLGSEGFIGSGSSNGVGFFQIQTESSSPRGGQLQFPNEIQSCKSAEKPDNNKNSVRLATTVDAVALNSGNNQLGGGFDRFNLQDNPYEVNLLANDRKNNQLLARQNKEKGNDVRCRSMATIEEILKQREDREKRTKVGEEKQSQQHPFHQQQQQQATQLNNSSIRMRSNCQFIESANNNSCSRAGEISRRKTLCRDNFEILKRLGEGVFGAVYMVRDKQSRGVFALKVILKEQVVARQMQAQMNREIMIHGSKHCDHENILACVGSFSDEKHYYLLLEYADEGTCAELLQRSHQHRIQEAEASRFIFQLLQALAHLSSQGIIHRDIKLENVLLSNQGVKLCDFGCATFEESESKKQTGRRRSFCGTLDYVAPEMIKDQIYDCKIDVWAVAVLAFELVAGKPPFAAATDELILQAITKVNYKFPPHFSLELRSFVSSAFVTDYKRRPSVQELLRHSWVAVNARIQQQEKANF